jgi:PAS domain S-box-containing protein
MNGVMYDITERKQAEEALKEKTYDLSERVKELNCLYGISALVEQQGISLEEILEGTADLIPLSWQYPEITCARIILESQEYRTQNFKVTIWKQASDIVVHGERTGAVEVYYLEEKPEIDEGPFLKEERSLINAIAERLGRIIEHNQAAEQVELARRRLADILEAMIDGVTIVDLTGKITYINRGTTEQLGYSSEEAVGRTPAEIFLDEKELPKFLNRVKASMTGETATGEGYLAKRKDGTRFPISVNISVLRDAHGEPESIVAVHRDVTEHERAADELRQAREAAEAASQAKSEFLANMSHEIRTPMNSVIGFTDMLLDSNLDEDQVDYASTIKSSGEALLSLINDILDFSKIEAAELGFEEIDFDPELLAYDVCDLIRPRIRSKQIEILCRISDNLPSQVKGDPGRFRQVLANLMANSTKFTDSGEIELSLDVEEETDDQIKLHATIRDTGIGIPKDKLATIFDPFQQADGSTTRKYGGTGLGLSICKKISELMHGNIWAESPADCQLSIVNWRLEDNSEIRNRKSKIENPGSIFHFTGWLGKAEVKEAKKFVPVSLSEKKALIVDDNQRNLDILTHVLDSVGMRVVALRNGEEVVPTLKKTMETKDSFDFCIIDIQMPGMSGYEVAKGIRSFESTIRGPKSRIPNLPLIALSSLMERDAKRCKEAGFDGFLSKPIQREKLYQMLERLLGEKEDEVEKEEGVREKIITQYSVREEMKHSVRILLAEDNPVNQKLAKMILTKAGYQVEVANNGKEAVEKFTSSPDAFDLIFMDVQMPEMDGLTATQQIRNPQSPIEIFQLSP